ncbi:M15 family metallopeptidase [Cellulomonas triticagri]|uniref:M15 family metallopeptidase n=1 Tax=Cellulomonas triticagri TaxID=2483352 RepID=UPI001F3999DC|nr:M15 family metallopeptidase [Cellulomonas triticagri]
MARQRARRTGAQVLSVLAVGGLTVGLLLHRADGTPAPDQADAPRSADQGDPRAAAPRVDPPLVVPTEAAPAEDRAAAPDGVDLLDLPDLPRATPLDPPTPLPLLERYPTGDPASPWVVVNKALPLVPGDYAPTDLVVVGGYEVRAALADPLSRMLAAAAAEGVGLELRSGFRSAAYQEQVHADWTGRLGEPRADEVSARPGHSEHQTGLAVDVGSSSAPACDFEACFEQTAEGRWVAARAGEFGFLVRYTAANQAVTGYAPEGWHLRYVGTDLVAEMRARGVTTLEELFGLPGGPDYR